MAKIEDIMPDMVPVKGKKRRQWLVDDQEDNLDNPVNNEENDSKIIYLRGNPLLLSVFLFENADKKSRTTKRLLLQDIVTATNIKRNSIRSAIRFLIKSDYLSRVDYELGLNGGTKYKLSKKLYNDIEIHKSGV